MYSVYVAACEDKRIYVGTTKTYRLVTRMGEHHDPTCVATVWTTKYPVIQFVSTFPVGDRSQTLRAEHRLTERLMEVYGLDAVRGGDFVMGAEGGTWWVRHHLKHIPRFTKLWSNLSSHNFVGSVRNDPILSEVEKLHRFSNDLQSPSARAPIEPLS